MSERERDYGHKHALGKAERALKVLEHQYPEYEDPIDSLRAFLVDLFHLARLDDMDLSDEDFLKLIQEARTLNSREAQVVPRSEWTDDDS